MDELSLADNPILFGADATAGIVAAELAGRFIRLFIRTPDGLIFKDEPFHPFILLEDPALLGPLAAAATLHPLAGNGAYRHLATFSDWHHCLAARDHLARHTGHTPSAPDAPYLSLTDPVHQHLLLTGKTFFKGLPFSGLRRLALDIETACAPGYEFSNPRRAEDRIISIAVMDEAGYEAFLSGREFTEPQLLERLTAIIRERDPDVIEGHNLFRFDLEYLRIRAERYGISLRWGRDGSTPRVHSARFSIAERQIDYPRWDIYGRSVIDTYFLVQLYDVSSRELESYGLKQAARHFGLAAADRTYLDRGTIDEIFASDPERLRRYNLDDVRETLALSRLLSHPWFLQARMFPYSYQNCIVRGNATKIDALFIREYLRRGTAIPRPAAGGGELAGGYTDVCMTGVVGPVVHCDVASLYPSIMLAFGLAPHQESLGLFLPLLRDLRDFRLRAKALARTASTGPKRDYYAALQQTFKILINSFYGYLGTTIHHFADLGTAMEVTRTGRRLIQEMLIWLREHHARPVEIDTDGIYFIPPPGNGGPEEENTLVRDLSATLPPGIEVEQDGRYQAMFSYKMKNYALLDYAGKITVRGSALRSRGIEPYLREFTAEVIARLLAGESDNVPALYDEYLRRLRDHRFTIERLARTETLGESPATYLQKVRQGKRPPAAAYEIALRANHEYRAGDQISYYVTGQGKGIALYESCRPVSAYDPRRPDENTGYYIDRLDQVMKRFAPFLPGERSLFD